MATLSQDEPKTYYQTAKHDHWRKAMMDEVRSFEEKGTWTLQELPAGKRAIDSKWVYRIKYKPNGDVERSKARLWTRDLRKWKEWISMRLLHQ